MLRGSACRSRRCGQLDEATPLKTTDARLLRRMCRDYNFRGHSASRTLSMWSNVRRGEGTWIFPHQDAVRTPIGFPDRAASRHVWST